nr:hypothetical protein [Tanacetum cinerariifolium]
AARVASATEVAATAFFQVVVAHAFAVAGALVHGQLADAVAEVDFKIEVMDNVGAVLNQQGRIYLVANVDGACEEVFGPKADAAAPVGEVAAHVEAIDAEAALVALQLHLLPAVKAKALNSPHFAERIRSLGAGVKHKALVAGCVDGVGVVVVEHRVVRVDAAVQRQLARVHARKNAGAVGIFLARVVVVGNNGVAAGSAKALNRAGRIAHEGRHIQVNLLLHHRAVADFVVVGVLGSQLRITDSSLQRVGRLPVGVQKLQRGALNAAVIGQLEYVAVVKFAREVHA